MREADAIARLRRIATHPGARGLADDAALIDGLVFTHDSIAEGVHFLPHDPPASVGWKLVAVNLSDLAAKGAMPLAGLLSLTLSAREGWVAGFLDGIAAACEHYGLALIGGDTIALPAGAPLVLGLTAIGRAGERTPSRSGGRPGDRLWLVGTLGDSAAGLALLKDDQTATGALVAGKRMRSADRPRRTALVSGVRRRSRKRSGRAAVRGDGRRRLCAACGARPGDRSLKPLFTGTRESDCDRNPDPGRCAAAPRARGGARRAAGVAWP
jgi:thiamin-phosphate kinase